MASGIDLVKADLREARWKPRLRACSPKGGAGMATRSICQSRMVLGLVVQPRKAAWMGRCPAKAVTSENADAARVRGHGG